MACYLPLSGAIVSVLLGVGAIFTLPLALTDPQAMQISEAEVRAALQTIYDPELGLDIVNLGLIYDITIDQGDVRVLMTMTAPGCPLHDSICGGAAQVIDQLPGVEHVEIVLTWDPPWDPSRMSDAARFALGFD